MLKEEINAFQQEMFHFGYSYCVYYNWMYYGEKGSSPGSSEGRIGS